MNKINMLKAVYYIYTQVSDDMFDMEAYRRGTELTRKCNTVGCAYGHLTSIIPTHKIKRYEPPSYSSRRDIDFQDTVDSILDVSDEEGSFLSDWRWSRLDNTRNGFCQRVLYLLTVKTQSLDANMRMLKRYQKIDVVKTYNKLKAQLEQ